MPRKWTDEEQAAVDAAWLALCELHGKTMTVGLSAMYMRILHDFAAFEAVRAIEYAIQTSKWFPKPSELLDTLRGSREEAALRAWLILEKTIQQVGTWRSVLFEDPRMCAVIKFFGGWEQVGNWPIKEMDYRRGEFIKAYAGFDNPPPSTMLPGAGERAAMASNFPKLYGWAAVSKTGEITQMRKELADNRSDVIDLPVPQHTLPAPQKQIEHTDGPLVPITKFAKQLIGVFK